MIWERSVTACATVVLSKSIAVIMPGLAGDSSSTFPVCKSPCVVTMRHAAGVTGGNRYSLTSCALILGSIPLNMHLFNGTQIQLPASHSFMQGNTSQNFCLYS